MNHDALRALPAVHVLAEDARLADSVQRFGRDAVVQSARSVLEAARQRAQAGEASPDLQALAEEVVEALDTQPSLYTAVINATGVVLHTNLGRAPIADAAWRAMEEARGPCDLEFDLSDGARASRLREIETHLCTATSAEAGLVVNNNAAAVLLGLAALAGKKPTAISRGHLVEIGGGFRLPSIMEASGSPLLEVGTTNRTHLEDYQRALDEGAALVLLVHRSNFVMEGYVSEPTYREILELAEGYSVPVMLDLGSGALVDTEPFGLPAELTVQRAVAQGFATVCFSGDKLLGGPQAGYLVGHSAAIAAMREHPLARALRCDKVQLAGTAATLQLYNRGEALRTIPVWQQISADVGTLGERAHRWRERLGVGDVIDATDTVGGGSLPDARQPSVALAIDTDDPSGLLASLRQQDPPVIAHIVRNRVLVHPRTVPKSRDDDLVGALRAALNP